MNQISSDQNSNLLHMNFCVSLLSRIYKQSAGQQDQLERKICRMTLRHKEHQGDTRMDGSPSWGSNLAPLCHSIYRTRAGSQIGTQRGHSEDYCSRLGHMPVWPLKQTG